MKIRLVSKQLGSRSLKDLAASLSQQLGYKVWRSQVPRHKFNNIRYGDCKDKVAQYKYFADYQLPTLEYTTSPTQAEEWSAEGHVVVGRKLTMASEGRGIVLIEPETPFETFPICPVYTKYKKKKKEFRVHIFKDKVVAVLEKRRKKDWEGQHETKVRNLANGYVFCSENVVEPEGLRTLALQAAKVTQSDFKGVDIGYNEKKNELFVIEVNSAPGIMGENIKRYTEVILNEMV